MTNECWVAVTAKPQAEARVKWGIEAARITTFCPVERLRVKQRDGERYVIIRPLLPGYIFAKCDPARLSQILEIDGVRDVLRKGGKVTRVPDQLMEVFQEYVAAGAFDKTRVIENLNDLQEGAEVRIKDAPPGFEDLVWRIKSASSKRRIEIVADFIHRLTVSFDKLERVEA